MLLGKIQLFFAAAIACINFSLNHVSAQKPQPKLKGSFTVKGKQQSVLLIPLAKDPKRKGFVKITYSTFENNDIVFKTKSVAMK